MLLVTIQDGELARTHTIAKLQEASSLCQQILHNHVMFMVACHAKLSHDRAHVKTLAVKVW